MNYQTKELIRDVVLGCCFSHYLIFVWMLGSAYLEQRAAKVQPGQSQIHLIRACNVSEN